MKERYEIMKLLKKIAIGTLCFSLLASGPSVLAASDGQTLDDTASQLMEEAENLDPNSVESVEKFSQTLESWDTQAAVSYAETTSNTGTTQYSIQQLFAKLQLQQAQIAKEQAQKRIDEIQKQQNTSKQLTELMNELRQFSSTIENEPLELTSELKEKLITLDICSETDEILTKKLTKSDVDELIEKVEYKQETVGSDTQQNMVYIQDYIGQYNSYLQNSNAAIAASADALSSSSIGGTMLGGSMGMLFTGILIGACIGIVVVLVVQKSRKKED